MPLLRLNACHGHCLTPEDFDDTCVLDLDEATWQALQQGRCQLQARKVGEAVATVRGLSVRLEDFVGTLHLLVGGHDGRLHLRPGCRGHFDVRLWRQAEVDIGAGTTSNGVRIVSDLSTVRMGADCMLSDEILVQSHDQHGLVDLRTGQIVNDRRRSTVLGDHVWLGRRSTLMPDVSIGSGAIVGACAVVTRDVAPCTLVVGTPARPIRQDVSWTRQPSALDDWSRAEVARRAVLSPESGLGSGPGLGPPPGTPADPA
jgi:acetyltransferase-like isoleucine patch superfamily enzyme